MFVALGMVVLIGILGLAIDIGYYRYVRRELQTAGDAAALAGAMDLSYSDVTTAAQAASSEDGFANGSNGVTVTVFNPPHDGPYAEFELSDVRRSGGNANECAPVFLEGSGGEAHHALGFRSGRRGHQLHLWAGYQRRRANRFPHGG